MTIHTFTTEQMRKFVDAVGGGTYNQEIAGGVFLTANLRRLTRSVGGLQDWPKITDDPRVNYAVDCVTADLGDPEPRYNEKLYADEVEAFRTNGSFA